jgi:hypothetical protein
MASKLNGTVPHKVLFDVSKKLCTPQEYNPTVWHTFVVYNHDTACILPVLIDLKLHALFDVMHTHIDALTDICKQSV